jgi:putative ABC transport system substrate-binding protein
LAFSRRALDTTTSIGSFAVRKPAELPVEQPTNFELVVNRAAAKGLGLTIPPSVLLRADAVLD